MPQLNILVADDHEVVRQGISSLLGSQPDWHVCGEANNGRDAVRLAGELQPGVVLLDIAMPELNGVEATRQIRKVAPDSHVLIFTMHDAEHLVQEVFLAGASGYVLKSDVGKHLVKAVRAIAEGHHFFSRQVSEVIFEGFLRAHAPDEAEEEHEESRLTPREREIIQMLAEGRSNKEVASTLGISVKTAETHRAAIMRKLSLSTVSGLVRYAVRNHIIDA